ncbi:site-specific integrase [Bifidobacterium imperatoris]|uniref:Integrase n=1 Tax=Bifidobacterium imperatoris TaxID=2020965 RepID=A0A2N5ITI8_9BIFI|nr:site-specific integrase [Bifidobacterium imperatoris]PLS25282.1 integrase [Bifidobacterium imperatoris]QSY58160.1 site-specific integrase [Bifidobacterium imperatoris]
MPGPYAYQTREGEKRYYVKYRLPNHKQKTKRGFKRKKDAQDYLARVTIDLNDGSYIDPRSGLVRVESLAATFLAGKKGTVKPKYYADLESTWENHVKLRWGGRGIGTIRRSEIQSWVSALSEERSASVVQRAHTVIKGILEMAVSDGLLRESPCKDIELPKKIRKQRTYLTEKQVLDLADASEDYSTLILVLGFCGLRMGEARGLRVHCIDFANGRLNVEKSVTRVQREYVESEPKTWERRSVPVPSYVMDKLREQCEGKKAEDLVFVGRWHGRYLGEYRKGAYGWYARALASSGVPELTLHDLRHTAASIAIHSGANVKAIQRMLGHKTAAMTLDTYADLFDSDLDVVAERVNELILNAA